MICKIPVLLLFVFNLHSNVMFGQRGTSRELLITTSLCADEAKCHILRVSVAVCTFMWVNWQEGIIWFDYISCGLFSRHRFSSWRSHLPPQVLPWPSPCASPSWFWLRRTLLCTWRWHLSRLSGRQARPLPETDQTDEDDEQKKPPHDQIWFH